MIKARSVPPMAATGVALLVTAIAGCAASGTQTPSEPPVQDNPPALVSFGQIQLPLARYVLTPREAATFENAVAILARSCAQRFDVTSTLRTNNVSLASDALLLEGRYGFVLNPGTAKRFGYQGAPQDRLAVENSAKGSSDAWNPSPRESEVMTGRTTTGGLSTLADGSGKPLPQGGCLAEGSQLLQVDQNYRDQLIQLVSLGASNTLNEVDSDSRMSAVNARWSQCMREKGYSLTSRGQAGNYAATRPRLEQVKTATDDVTCAQAVNWFGVRYALDCAYQDRFVSEHAAELKVGSDGVQKALRKAGDIVAQGH